jgi:hypothetical protein
MNFYRRWRRDDSLLMRSIGRRFNEPLPAATAIFVNGESRATAFPDLHLPVIVVGRYCERVREHSRDHDAAQHSTQKHASHFSIPQLRYTISQILLPRSVRWILLCHLGAMPCSLFWIDAVPHTALSGLRNSPSRWFRRPRDCAGRTLHG